jgi:hypothetical protein
MRLSATALSHITTVANSRLESEIYDDDKSSCWI